MEVCLENLKSFDVGRLWQIYIQACLPEKSSENLERFEFQDSLRVIHHIYVISKEMPQKIRDSEKLPVVLYRKLSSQTYVMSMEGKLMGEKIWKTNFKKQRILILHRSCNFERSFKKRAVPI